MTATNMNVSFKTDVELAQLDIQSAFEDNFIAHINEQLSAVELNVHKVTYLEND